jgi:hypothetical protein
MQFLVYFVGILLFFSPALKAESLNGFKTDYCTGYVEGTRQNPDLWKHCCVEHDLYFWAGGSKKDRSKSDERLKACVSSTGQKMHAELIFLGVYFGGLSPFKIQGKQWGNGWKNRPSYEKLTEQETFEIFHFLETSDLNLDEKLKLSFINQLKSRLD